MPVTSGVTTRRRFTASLTLVVYPDVDPSPALASHQAIRHAGMSFTCTDREVGTNKERLPDEVFDGLGLPKKTGVHHTGSRCSKELREEGKSAQQSKEAPSGLNADDTTSILPAFDDQTPVTVLPWPTTLGRTGRRGSCGGSATPSYSQENSSLISTINFYEWLTGGLDGSISPDQNVILWDKAIEPPQSLTSFVALTEVSEAVLMGPSTEAMLINSPLRSSAKSLTNIGNFNPNW
ncbi:uncharacterized protein PHALS_12602 [Plasmopara halstedii]|uniref:Uncharacterized protein n=1 Tax=Plasmopara halstedii TaxID=4781 RepID=A0A0P1ALW0_PLAHL|nr:uncharacterized protein PHALS_12602 [Plasmopara halstedii]CEG42320.1 hypothetical protein PHALS_12602 [Plasmopara halstedii]|eukprot:XP_024578689.1 hypothetical protein PHALS_12602 [Plasmopara halstedii]